MKKLFFFLYFSFFLFNVAFSQNPLVKQWDYRYGGTHDEQFWATQQTADGGYIIGGWSVSDSSGNKTQDNWPPLNGNHSDMWIVKTDFAGNKEWDKRFGGLNHDYLFTLEQTKDNGYILGGPSVSDTGGDKTQNTWGSLDYWIVKTDSLGNKQWDKDFGGTNEETLFSIQQTADGGYILGGFSKSQSNGDKSQDIWGGFDYWIVKTDSLGNKQWDKDFGGTDHDYLYSLQQTADGGFILGGWSQSGIGGDKSQPAWNNSYDYWIVKTDSLGNKQWDKDYGGIHLESLYSILQTSDGGYILGGGSTSDSSGDKTQDGWGGTDYWIVKTDSLGNKQWDKDFGGTANDHLQKVTQTADGGFLLSGESVSSIGGNKTENNLGNSQTWMIKTDSLGNFQWDKTVFSPGKDFKGRVIETTDGCYVSVNMSDGVIGGYKTQPNWDTICDPSCTSDYWIIKFCDTTSTTSITQLPNPQLPFSIYPNPASESIAISSKFGIEKIEIFNLLGKTVLSASPSPTGRVGVGLLPNGLYIIKAYTEKGVFQQKLVVNH
jgi:hypothetical protein